jgi:EmrB/QacA subfamily drug resistance transporter
MTSQQLETVTQESTRIDAAKLITLLVLSLALAIVIIDGTIVNIALPSIQTQFAISVNDLEWISAIYALVFGGFLLTWGRLGDEFGRRRIFMAGILTFISGSMVTGFANGLPMILLGRLVQGFGAAMASPSTLSILTTTFYGRSRGIAFGIWGAVAGAAGALGPLIGGYLTTYATWRWAFLINVPIGIVALAGAYFFIKESRSKSGRYDPDYRGTVLVSSALALLIFGLIEGQTYGWLAANQVFKIGSFSWPFTSVAITPVAMALGLVLATAFVLNERSRLGADREVLLDLRLLGYRGFRFGLLTVGVVAMGEFGIFFILSLYFQLVRGMSALSTGYALLPFAGTAFFAAPLAGVLTSRVGAKWIVTTGMTLEATSLILLSQLTGVNTSLTTIYAILALYGVGVGLAIGQLTGLVVGSIPPQNAGVASGANSTIRQLGAAFGVAIIGAVLVAQVSATGLAQLQASTVIPPYLKAVLTPVFSQGLIGGSAPSLPASVTNSPIGLAIQGIFNSAITDGVRYAALVAGFFVSLGAISSLLLPNDRGKESLGAEGERSGYKAGRSPGAEAY